MSLNVLCLQPEAGHENTGCHRDVEGHDSDQKLSPKRLCCARDARMVQTRHIEPNRPDRRSSASPRKRRFHIPSGSLYAFLHRPVESATLIGQYQVPPPERSIKRIPGRFSRERSRCVTAGGVTSSLRAASASEADTGTLMKKAGLRSRLLNYRLTEQ
jgi:hypothetical protein